MAFSADVCVTTECVVDYKGISSPMQLLPMLKYMGLGLRG